MKLIICCQKLIIHEGTYLGGMDIACADVESQHLQFWVRSCGMADHKVSCALTWDFLLF